MLRIIRGNTIEYTKDDTFELSVDSDTGFEESDTLRLVIAESETASPNVDNTYNLSSDGSFLLTLTDTDKKNLSIGSYIYKLIHNDNFGKTITQLSGNFIVKWGA